MANKNFKTIENKKYIPSKNIKVYPCTYRGVVSTNALNDYYKITIDGAQFADLLAKGDLYAYDNVNTQYVQLTSRSKYISTGRNYYKSIYEFTNAVNNSNFKDYVNTGLYTIISNNDDYDLDSATCGHTVTVHKVTSDEQYLETKEYYLYNTTKRALNGVQIYDPEARLSTEANFADKYAKRAIGNGNDSYIIGWSGADSNDGTLSCVIGGYYFKITNISLADFIDSDGNVLSLLIQTGQVSLISNTEQSGTDDAIRTTSILRTYYDGAVNQYLDARLPEGEATNGELSNLPYFTGLVIANPDKIEYTACLSPVRIKEHDENNNVVPEINWSARTLDAVVTTGTGTGSIKTRTLNDNTEMSEGDNSYADSDAAGKYAIAYGQNNKVSADYSVAIGSSITVTAGEGNIVSGNNSTVSGSYNNVTGENNIVEGDYNSVNGVRNQINGYINVAIGSNNNIEKAQTYAFGNNLTNATSNNRMIIGSYNDDVPDDLFEIGNGTSRSQRRNVFAVDEQGNTTIRGNINVKEYTEGYNGSINPTTLSVNIGDAGTKTKGQLNIYGNINDATNSIYNVFNVDPNGDTHICGHSIDISSKGTPTIHTITVGSIATNDSGALNIFGAGPTTVFNVTNTGETNIKDTVDIENTKHDLLHVHNSKNHFTISQSSITSHFANTETNATDVTEIVTNKDGLTIYAATETQANTVSITSSAASIQLNDNHKFRVDSTSAELQANSITVTGNTKVEVAAPKIQVIGSRLAIIGNTTSNQIKLTNSSVTITSASTSMSGNLTVNENLVVTGNTTLNDNVTINNKSLTITGTDSSGSTATVVNNCTISNTGDIDTNGYIKAKKSITTEGDLTVSGAHSAFIQGRSINLYYNSNSEEVAEEDKYFVNITADADKLNISKPINITGGITANGEVAVAGCESFVVTNATSTTETASVTPVLSVTPEETVINSTVALTITSRYVHLTGTPSNNSPTLQVDNGYIEAQSYNATSDIRKKTNIESFSPSKSILSLDVKKFEYREDLSHKQYIGCIAQDLQEICPEIVDTDADGYLSIQETKLVYLLLDEVKKLKEEIAEIKKEA